MKNPGTKELGQTVSDKARTTIVIAVKLKPSYEGLSFLCAVILYVQPHYGYNSIYIVSNILFLYSNVISGRFSFNSLMFFAVKSLRKYVREFGAFRTNLINAFCGISGQFLIDTRSNAWQHLKNKKDVG